MRNYAGMCKGICRYNLVYRFLIFEIPVFVVHFPNAFWQGNEAFPQVSSQNETVPLLVIFHLPYSKYRGVKIYFHLCRTRVVPLALVLHSQHSCRTCVALVLLVCHSCRACVARVWHSCCKLDQMVAKDLEKSQCSLHR